MSSCKYCGAELEQDSHFCLKCGKPVEQKPANTKSKSRMVSKPELISPEPKSGFSIPSKYRTIVIAVVSILLLSIVAEVASHFIANKDNKVATDSKEDADESMEKIVRPKHDDFTWFTENITTGSMPEGHATISDFDKLKGAWKGLIYTDPLQKKSCGRIQILNFVVSGTKSDVNIIADWYGELLLGTGAQRDERDEPNGEFHGEWRDKEVSVSGDNMKFTIERFWEEDGKQYATGTMDNKTGVQIAVAMVRP